MSDNITHITDSSFEDDVLKHDGPVLVDFWAEWCGPCRMIAPLLERTASEYEGKIKITKMDIDSNQETPAKYSVRGIPTLLIFKGGEVVATKVGAMSNAQLSQFVESAL